MAILGSRVSPHSLAGQPAGSQEGHTLGVVLQTSGNRIRMYGVSGHPHCTGSFGLAIPQLFQLQSRVWNTGNV